MATTNTPDNTQEMTYDEYLQRYSEPDDESEETESDDPHAVAEQLALKAIAIFRQSMGR